MKLGSLIAVFGLLPALAATAGRYVDPYNWMTGEDVVRRILTVPEKPSDYIERDMAQAYVNGIKDGTAGLIWCFTGSTLPHELNIEIAGALKDKRTPAELKGNAAPLIQDELRKRYPCHGSWRW